MDAEYKPTALPQWIDLTGLPDEFVWTVRQLVADARQRYNVPEPTSRGLVYPQTNPEPEEFRRLLDEMAAMGMGDAPPLPADWSRADLYDDHD